MRIAASEMTLILATVCSIVCISEDVSGIQVIEDDSAAIQAAWREVTSTVPAEPGQTAYRPDGQDLSWFLGFFEGRAKVTPPNWWQEVVLDSQAYSRDDFFRGEPKSDPYHAAGPVWCPKGASLRQEGHSIIYQTKNDSIIIPVDLLKLDARSMLSRNYSGLFTSKRFFVAVHDDSDYDRKLSCVSRSTGKVLWTSELCGKYLGMRTGPPPAHSWATVVATDDGRVFVFGASEISFYAHGFRAKDGESLIEFSSMAVAGE